MFFPKYWSKEESESSTPEGKRRVFAVWRWSESSAEDAQHLAKQAAEQIAKRIQNGEDSPERYAYGERPVREEVIHSHTGEGGEVSYALTRNRYGTVVLNTARVMFVDVDIENPRPKSGFVHRLKRMFGGSEEKKAEDPVEKALQRLREWLVANPDWGVRVYRTRGGLRYLVTHELFEPGDSKAEEALDFLGSDPRYQTLCRVQQSFRARLTPKPWRCNVERPPATYPYNNDQAERKMRQWEDKYHAECEHWSTCAYLEHLGRDYTHEEVTAIQRLHDELTGINRSLPLA